MLGLFITGTDTGVGKTHVAAMIARHLAASGVAVGVYKPVASGCRRQGGELVSDDAVALWEAAGRPHSLDRVCPQRFEAPLAPALAAAAEGRRVDESLLEAGARWWSQRCDLLVVEGAGGLMCPLGEHYVADLADALALPLVVVARNALGTINHALLTLIAADVLVRRAAVAGLVVNNATPADDDASRQSNRAELARRSPRPVLCEVAHGATAFAEDVDWRALAAARFAAG